MAGEYLVDMEVFRGEIDTAMAAAEAYIETLVKATAAVISINIVGDNNYCSVIVCNNTTP
jgi:hypothetical protein